MLVLGLTSVAGALRAGHAPDAARPTPRCLWRPCTLGRRPLRTRRCAMDGAQELALVSKEGAAAAHAGTLIDHSLDRSPSVLSRAYSTLGGRPVASLTRVPVMFTVSVACSARAISAALVRREHRRHHPVQVRQRGGGCSGERGRRGHTTGALPAGADGRGAQGGGARRGRGRAARQPGGAVACARRPVGRCGCGVSEDAIPARSPPCAQPHQRLLPLSPYLRAQGAILSRRHQAI
jgi:hypothetical protein